MYCPECGKGIPDESKFCLHCGKPIISTADMKSTRPKISDKPPKYVANIGLNLNGILSANGREGFTVYFKLLDENQEAVSADGELNLELQATKPDFFAYRFRKKLPVKKEDFRYSTTNNSFFGYFFEHPEPELPDQYFVVRIKFKTNDGRMVEGVDTMWGRR